MADGAVQYHHFPGTFSLESGAELPGLQIAFTATGQRNAVGSNVIWVCHALTGNAMPFEWWRGLFGPGKLFDPKDWYVVCANMPGSCYGSSSALSLNPQSGGPYYHNFPQFSIRDIARAFDALRLELGIGQVYAAIGGSMGGQVVLEWAILQPDVFRHIVPIATNAVHSPWGIGWNEAQRMAIAADPSWATSLPDAGMAGLRAARAMAMLSYRTSSLFNLRQARTGETPHEAFRAASYLQYQGEKLAQRFDAFAYWNLSKSMDSHDTGRGRGGVETALKLIRAKTCVISIDSDLLFTPPEQELLASCIPGAKLVVHESLYGHDAFLTDTDAMGRIMRDFLS